MVLRPYLPCVLKRGLKNASTVERVEGVWKDKGGGVSPLDDL